jgi:hypothetical protein
MRMLGRLVSLVTTVVVAIIVVGIALVLLEANPRNDLVNAVLDGARWLADPFAGIFKPGSMKSRIAVNWGLAALVYSLVGGLIARLLLRR